jgi:hypothetical protein
MSKRSGWLQPITQDFHEFACRSKLAAKERVTNEVLFG